ncbi:HugZ family protein [Jiella sonneratiae]|uniref:HugZ family pyridoxamine 5'-phosphate oxidase n=1 Tax=Jiella sonneratiae TaxID=2816856 RepID=UPI003159ADA0
MLREVDEAARLTARMLLRPAREASLAVLRPSDGWPAVSKTLVATDFAGCPVIFVSQLSLHARALDHDRRCSLLAARPGKGDPLAHPRISIFANAEPVERGTQAAARIRARFLARHPKAELYVDFPDFRFFRLKPEGAALNGGFGKAFELSPADFVEAEDDELEAAGIRARDHMNADHLDAVDAIAARAGAKTGGWRIATVDRRGFEIANGDQMRRVEFDSDPAGDGGYRKAFVELVSAGRT